MTQFSRKAELRLSSIVAAGHPPIIHSIALKAGWAGIEAGVPLHVTTDGAELWDGEASVPVTPGVDPAPATVALPMMGIALNTPQAGDGSVLALLHGCYRADAVTVGGQGLTQAQALTLMAAGLYPEDSWGG